MAPVTPKPPRPRGRPKASEPRSAVMTWLPARTHDRLIQTAHARGMSVSAVVRAAVNRTLVRG